MAPKTILLVVHVLGVICGVGGVLMLDVHLLRLLRGAAVTTQDVKFTHFVSAFVKLGLIVVWISGLIVIAIAPDGPAGVLANPKLQAKLVVVVVLTINALFVETLALPLLVRNLGRPLFDGVNQVRRTAILCCGAVSTASWCYPVVLGLARELNQITPAQVILSCYATTLVVLGVIVQVAGRVLYRPTPAGSADAASAGGGDATVPGGGEPGARAAADLSEAQMILGLARQAGRLALADSVPLQQVAEVFTAFGSDDEREQFRAGLLEALRDQYGRESDVDTLLRAVAGNEAAQTKISFVAPHAAARNAFHVNMMRVQRNASDPRWSQVQDWHERLMNISAGPPRPGAAAGPRAAVGT